MTQNERILNHLKAHGSITPLEALDRYGCFRLAARIGELRSKGHGIDTDTVRRNGKHFAVYRLAKRQ